MTLRILGLAEADLLSGFRFYQRQGSGVGWYFLETVNFDIESLGFMRASILGSSVITAAFEAIPFCGVL